jgi:hypothetical protein
MIHIDIVCVRVLHVEAHSILTLACPLYIQETDMQTCFAKSVSRLACQGCPHANACMHVRTHVLKKLRMLTYLSTIHTSYMLCALRSSNIGQTESHTNVQNKPCYLNKYDRATKLFEQTLYSYTKSTQVFKQIPHDFQTIEPYTVIQAHKCLNKRDSTVHSDCQTIEPPTVIQAHKCLNKHDSTVHSDCQTIKPP